MNNCQWTMDNEEGRDWMLLMNACEEAREWLAASC